MEKRVYTASVPENYFEANKNKEHGDTRFELLGDNFALQTQVRENDVEFFFGGRSVSEFCYGFCSKHHSCCKK